VYHYEIVLLKAVVGRMQSDRKSNPRFGIHAHPGQLTICFTPASLASRASDHGSKQSARRASSC